jgi:hypothetical protein
MHTLLTLDSWLLLAALAFAFAVSLFVRGWYQNRGHGR